MSHVIDGPPGPAPDFIPFWPFGPWVYMWAFFLCVVATLMAGCRSTPTDPQAGGPLDLEAMTFRWAGGPSHFLAEDGSLLAEVTLERCAPLPARRIPSVLLEAFAAAEHAGACATKDDSLRPLIAALDPEAGPPDLEVPAVAERCAALRTLMFGDPLELGTRWLPTTSDTWIDSETPDALLRAHLNLVDLGEGDFGVEAGARAWLGQSATTVDAGGAALLAAIATRPTLRRNPTALRRARDRILDTMVERGQLEARERAVAERQHIPKRRTFQTRSSFPSIMAAVHDELAHGLEGSLALRQGVQAYTSIDPALLDAAAASILPVMDVWRKNREKEAARLAFLLDEYGYLPEEEGAEPVIPEELLEVLPPDVVRPGALLEVPDESPQVAVFAIEPHSGRVKVLLDGATERTVGRQGAMYRRRQPGSAWKPFVYATALEAGASQADVYVDEPRAYSVHGELWKPKNHEDKYLGAVTLRHALAASLNSVAIQLTLEVGPRRVVETARRLGIRSRLDPVPAVALGVSPVTLPELVSGYGVFAAGGHQVRPRFVDRVLDARGDALPWPEPEPGPQVLDPRIAYVMTDMLREVAQTGTAKKAGALPFFVAGKTGTTNESRDAWFIGYSSNLVAGVWVGFDARLPLGGNETGASLALPIWTAVMEQAAERNPPGRIEPPDGVVLQRRDPDTGRIDGRGTEMAIISPDRGPRLERIPDRAGAAESPAYADIEPRERL